MKNTQSSLATSTNPFINCEIISEMWFSAFLESNPESDKYSFPPTLIVL